MLPVALDAMGGDHAPGEIVAGAIQATKDEGVSVVLVGPPDLAVRVDTDGLPQIEASEVIGMHDDAAQGVRRKKDATVVRAAEAVRDGVASAMLSAGNTGAAMAAALLRMGRIRGVSRPAIATPIPVIDASPTVLLDAGANAEVQPEWLVQFAQMGSVFSRHRFGIERPRVGLLTIGEEPGKGDTLRKEAYELLCSAAGIDFIGNVEGRDITTDAVDVVVTDGFTGNVVLKTLEGTGRSVVRWLDSAFASNPELAPALDALRRTLAPLYAAIDPETYGGAMLLGVEGVCVIAHGSSSARAVVGALKVARDMAEAEVVDELRAAVAAGP